MASVGSPEPIRLGLAISPGFGVDQSPYEQMCERLELVRVARSVGFSSISMGEHYLASPSPYFQNIPFMARLAAEAEGMDIYGVIVLSLHHPIEIAEQSATLDIISGGFFKLVVCLGWRKTEFEIFRVPYERRVRRYLEQIALIRTCWAEKNFTFDGEFYKIDEPVSSLSPIQTGGVPILMGPSSERMARRIAHYGDGYLGSGHTTWSGMETIVDAYRDELAKLGKPLPADVSAIRNCYVAEDRETALREAAPYVEDYYRQFGGWGLFRDVIKSGPEQPDQAAILHDRVILGSPDDVASDLRRYNERFGINHFVCRVGWQGMDNLQVARAITLLGQEVIPRLAS